MNKEQFIKDKIEKLESKMYDAEDQLRKRSLSLGFWGLAAVAASLWSFATTSSLIYFLTMLSSMSLANFMTFRTLRSLDRNKIKNLERNKLHLQALSKNSLNDSKELNKRRQNKIDSLRKCKNKQNKQLDNCFSKILGSAFVQAAGVFFTYFTPIGFVPVIIGSIGFKRFLGSYEKLFKKDNELATRILNIKNDLDVIGVTRQSERKAANNNLKKDYVRLHESTKNIEKTYNSSPISNNSRNASMGANEEIVEKYIRSLENQQNKEIPKKNRKH